MPMGRDVLDSKLWRSFVVTIATGWLLWTTLSRNSSRSGVSDSPTSSFQWTTTKLGQTHQDTQQHQQQNDDMDYVSGVVPLKSRLNQDDLEALPVRETNDETDLFPYVHHHGGRRTQDTTASGAWIMVDESSRRISKRHEACFVMVDDHAYLIGGRAEHPVDRYNPVTRTWCRDHPGPGIVLHHMQCVVVRDIDKDTGARTGPERYVYIVSAWTGECCMEDAVPNVWVYDTVDRSWDSTISGLAPDRLRGGAAAVLFGDEIYVTHGNQGGHGFFNGGVALTMVDKFNVQTNEWTALPDAGFARDHTGGAVVNGSMICVAGGRDGGAEDYRNAAVLPTECFDPVSMEWSVQQDFPFTRAGSLYGQTCDGKLMVAGGEFTNAPDGAYDDVAVFDGTSWVVIDSMASTRHGTGLAVDCSCQQIYAAGGATRRGGSGETNSVEHYFSNGVEQACPGRRPLFDFFFFLRSFWRKTCPRFEL